MKEKRKKKEKVAGREKKPDQREPRRLGGSGWKNGKTVKD